jgi:type I restriction-modification system DNA methylase subunit
VSQVVENTVNALLADYLRSRGLEITTEVSSHAPSGRKQPDFYLRDTGAVFGEGEWESSFIKGLKQAHDYGTIPGSSGTFVISYPEDLKATMRQRMRKSTAPEHLLRGTKFRGLLMMKGARAELLDGQIEEVAEWLRDGIRHRRRKESAGAFVSLMRDLVEGLSDYLPTSGDYPTFFEHIIATMPKDPGELETAKRAAAYLLLNQVVFYRILSQLKYPPLVPEELESTSELHTKFFARVLEDDYAAIFSSNIAEMFPDRALPFLQDMITYVNAVQPESFTRDLLGSIFHELIPLAVRKSVAAYYTNPEAARLLARLTIESADDGVADFSCGSGTLLMAAYDTKADLVRRELSQADHRRFLERDITGIDIMPFAAHLAAVQLALRRPEFLTDKIRIAVQDSTTLRPGTTISTLQSALPHGQARLQAFGDENAEKHRVRRGAISGQGAGQAFELRAVDVTLMNPPFTRKQLIGKEYRKMLSSRFRDYAQFESKGQSLFGYFVFLADRFLRPGGRMGFVLPASSIRQVSSEGMRQLIRERYNLEFLILSGHRMAFSEDAAFSEILLVARKRQPDKEDQDNFVLATIRSKPTIENLASFAKQLMNARAAGASGRAPNAVSSTADLDFRIASPDELQRADWLSLFPGEEEIGADFTTTTRLAPLREVIGGPQGIIQGIRFEGSSDVVNVRNTIISIPRSVVGRMHWEIIEEKKRTVRARSHTTGAAIEIPRKALEAAVRTASGLEGMEIATPPDFAVAARFDRDGDFWSDRDPDGLVARRKPHLDSRKGRLLISGRNHVDLVSDSTHFLAFCAKDPIVPTWNFWSIRNVSWDAARILCLWFNSVFAITHLYDKRITGTGTYVGWLKSDLLAIPVPKISALDPSSRERLIKLFDRLGRQTFPSLYTQLREHEQKRLELDMAIADCLQLTESSPSQIGEMYDSVVRKLAVMREVQTERRTVRATGSD